MRKHLISRRLGFRFELGANAVALSLSTKGNDKPPVVSSWMEDPRRGRGQPCRLDNPPDADQRGFQGVEVVTLDREDVHAIG